MLLNFNKNFLNKMSKVIYLNKIIKVINLIKIYKIINVIKKIIKVIKII